MRDRRSSVRRRRGDPSRAGALAIATVRIENQSMRVLVVEDHPRLAQTVASVLRREGIAVDVAFDGNEALARTSLVTYDVVVLDRDLPGVHGDDVCRTLIADGY